MPGPLIVNTASLLVPSVLQGVEGSNMFKDDVMSWPQDRNPVPLLGDWTPRGSHYYL